MFDPKAYKDEWTPVQKNSQPANTQNSNPTDKKDEKKDDFRHFDGSKANIDQSVATKYNEYVGRNETPTTQTLEDVDKLADEIMNSSKEPQPEAAEPISPVIEEKELEEAISKPDVKTDDSENLDQLLDHKTKDAIAQLEKKKQQKTDDKLKIEKDIQDIDSKMTELKKIAEDIKHKIQELETLI